MLGLNKFKTISNSHGGLKTLHSVTEWLFVMFLGCFDQRKV